MGRGELFQPVAEGRELGGALKKRRRYFIFAETSDQNCFKVPIGR
jgi:hypothetical protein